MIRACKLSDWTVLTNPANLLVLRRTTIVRISAILRAECSPWLLLRLHHYSVCLLPKKSVWGRGVCSSPLKANSHITRRANAVPLPCRVAKGLDCVFPIWFTQCDRVSFTRTVPRPCRAPTTPFWKRLLKATAQHGRDAALARHCMCELAFSSLRAHTLSSSFMIRQGSIIEDRCWANSCTADVQYQVFQRSLDCLQLWFIKWSWQDNDQHFFLGCGPCGVIVFYRRVGRT